MRVSSIRWGVIWIGVGLLFLAINLELLDSLVFPRLFSLWPILLVAIGVEIMFRRTRLYFLALLSPLLIAAAFMLAASARGDWGWHADEFWRRWEWSIGEKKVFVSEISADSTVGFLDIDLECGASQVSFRPSTSDLFKASTEYYKHSPWLEHFHGNRTEKIEYLNREKARLTFFGLNMSSSKTDFWVADYLPVKIAITALDKEPNYDFSDLIVSSLNLDLEADHASIRLGDLSDTIDVVMLGKVNDMTLVLPQNFGLAILGDSASLTRLLSLTDLLQANGGFESENYTSTAKRTRVMLSANVRDLYIVRE